MNRLDRIQRISGALRVVLLVATVFLMGAVLLALMVPGQDWVTLGDGALNELRDSGAIGAGVMAAIAAPFILILALGIFWLQRLLGYSTPDYAHIPVITHPDGDKLSKLTGAPGIPVDEVRPTLTRALAALQQTPPADLAASSLDDVWEWAMKNWQIQALQGLTAIREDRLPQTA